MANKPLINKFNSSSPDVAKFKSVTALNKLEKTTNPNIIIQNNENGYVCSCCGHNYSAQNEFYKSNSPLYQGNSGKFTVCKSCMNKLFEHYAEVLNDKALAIRRMCMKFDIYYNDDIVKAVLNSTQTNTIMAQYSVRASAIKYQGFTYDTTLDEEVAVIKSEKDLKQISEDSDRKITIAMQNRWGVGFTAEELWLAEDHYQYLKKNNPDAQDNQESSIIDLCKYKVLQNRAFMKNDIDSFNKCTDSYQKLFTKSKLVIGNDQEAIDESAAAWGKFIQNVEQYTPADLYKRPSLFKDVDGIGEYFQRFIVRPFRNFFLNEHNMDNEYNIDIETDEDKSEGGE